MVQHILRCFLNLKLKDVWQNVVRVQLKNYAVPYIVVICFVRIQNKT